MFLRNFAMGTNSCPINVVTIDLVKIIFKVRFLWAKIAHFLKNSSIGKGFRFL